MDEDATAPKRESLKSSKEEDYYTETTDGWLDDADVKEVKKVLKTLKITDSHTFTAPTGHTDTGSDRGTGSHRGTSSNRNTGSNRDTSSY